MEIDQEEMYRKLGAYFDLWHTVRASKWEALDYRTLSEKDYFRGLGGIEVIDAMLDDLYAVFPYPEQEPPIYQNWETA